jgi:hypothetical protein
VLVPQQLLAGVLMLQQPAGRGASVVGAADNGAGAAVLVMDLLPAHAHAATPRNHSLFARLSARGFGLDAWHGHESEASTAAPPVTPLHMHFFHTSSLAPFRLPMHHPCSTRCAHAATTCRKTKQPTNESSHLTRPAEPTCHARPMHGLPADCLPVKLYWPCPVLVLVLQ